MTISRYTLQLAICLSLLTTALACEEKKEPRQVPMDSFTVERQVALTADEDAPECSVKLNVCFAAGNDTTASAINDALCLYLFHSPANSLREAADSFVTTYTSDYVNFLTPFYKADRGNDERKQWYEYWYTLDTEARTECPGYISYIATHEYFEGGAHSVRLKTAINFDTNTGRQVKLNDLLVAGYERQLTATLLQELQDEVVAKSMDELHEKGYLNATSMFVTENFVLDADGLTFIYNPYEIAPYENGLTELHIGNDELKDLIKK